MQKRAWLALIALYSSDPLLAQTQAPAPEPLKRVVRAQRPAKRPIEWSLHGKVFTDHYGFIQGPQAQELAQSSLSIWPEIEAKFNDSWSSRGVFAANLFFKSLNDPDALTAKVDVREAYLSYQKNGWDVRAGQQIIPWGKSDGVNPTDYFTAKDYTFLVPDDELRRRGELSLNIAYTPNQGDSPWNIQTVFQARYPQAKMLIPELTLPSGISLDRYAPAARYFNTEDMQGGARLQYLGTDLDFSFSAFRGTSVFPLYQLNPSIATIQAYHPQQTALGGDVSFNIGESSVMRVETALLLPDNGTDTDPYFGLVQPQHWDTVVGLERVFGEDFRVQGQFLMRYYLYYQDPSEFNDGNPLSTQIQQAIGRSNALILNFPSQTNPGLTLRVAYASQTSNWTGDIFLLGYFAAGNDYLIRSTVGYKPMDDFKLQVGADLYGGNENKTLGALKDRSAVFFDAKYFF